MANKPTREATLTCISEKAQIIKIRANNILPKFKEDTINELTKVAQTKNDL